MHGLYLTPDEELVVTAQTRLTGITLGMIAYEVSHEQRRLLTRMQMPLTGGGTIDTFRIRAGSALLDTANVYVLSGTVQHGEVACHLSVEKTSGSERFIGYTSNVVFPDTNTPGGVFPRVEPSLADDGWYSRTITGADPSAGAEVSQTVPTGLDWRLLSFRTTLVTDANVANRQVFLTFTDGVVTYQRWPANATQAASLSYTYIWGHGSSVPALTGLFAFGPLVQQCPLVSGIVINTSTTDIQVGDNFTSPFIHVLERLTLARS